MQTQDRLSKYQYCSHQTVKQCQLRLFFDTHLTINMIKCHHLYIKATYVR